MQGIFWRLQKCLAVGITAQFAGGRKDSRVYKVRENSVKIVGDLPVIPDVSADVVQS